MKRARKPHKIVEGLKEAVAHARKARAAAIAIKPGDWVLVGSEGAMPWQWWCAPVIWADDRDVLLDRSNSTGSHRWRQHENINCIRAAGTIAHCHEIKDLAAKETRILADRVSELESELGRARDAVWTKIKQMHQGGIAVAPLDKEAIAAEVESYRRAADLMDGKDTGAVVP